MLLGEKLDVFFVYALRLYGVAARGQDCHSRIWRTNAATALRLYHDQGDRFVADYTVDDHAVASSWFKKLNSSDTSATTK